MQQLVKISENPLSEFCIWLVPFFIDRFGYFSFLFIYRHNIKIWWWQFQLRTAEWRVRWHCARCLWYHQTDMCKYRPGSALSRLSLARGTPLCIGAKTHSSSASSQQHSICYLNKLWSNLTYSKKQSVTAAKQRQAVYGKDMAYHRYNWAVFGLTAGSGPCKRRDQQHDHQSVGLHSCAVRHFLRPK